MKINVREGEDVVRISLSGSFETVVLPTFSETLERFMEKGVSKFCVNVRGLEFINSTALGYFVAKGKELNEGGGALVFSEPSRFFAATFRTLELHHLFEMFASDEKAEAHLAALQTGGA